MGVMIMTANKEYEILREVYATHLYGKRFKDLDEGQMFLIYMKAFNFEKWSEEASKIKLDPEIEKLTNELLESYCR